MVKVMTSVKISEELHKLAKEAGISFSHTLEEALLEKLGKDDLSKMAESAAKEVELKELTDLKLEWGHLQETDWPLPAKAYSKCRNRFASFEALSDLEQYRLLVSACKDLKKAKEECGSD